MSEISIVIPAYNEEKRLRGTLDNYISYFSMTLGDQFEIVVVCDGYKDNTLKIAQEFSNRFPQVTVLSFPNKLGKGGAIKEGVKVVSSDIMAYSDADGATRPEDIWKLAQVIHQGYDGAIGSRWLPESHLLVRQSFNRRVASRVFNLLVRLLFGLPFRDTQCGAKVFRSDLIRQVIGEVNSNEFAFDVDLLWRCKQRGYNVKEVAISWQDRSDSTLVLHKDAPKMLGEILKLRLKR